MMPPARLRPQSVCPRCGVELAPDETGQCPRCLSQALFKANPPEPAPSHGLAGIRRLGDYELLEEIARGGMGIVYRARQVSLNRIVAVKLMRDSALAGTEELRRFRVEAAAAAKLKHPHIVAIHEVGEQDGQHYFAMDLVEGTNLARRTRENPLPAREAAQLVATIAEAVQHAHERGVLHRDLKPSNVLLDGEGRPFVTDFGLARSLEADSSLTMTGQVLGTPGYMPPEQATGQGTVGPGADIYSLGAVLYCLLTGRAPFVGGTPAETMRHVVEQEPVSPQIVNPEVPRDLASVCLKCLAKRPGDRYFSASYLAADLRRFVRGEPTHARPAGQTERLWRWCRRKPALASAIGSVALVGAIGLSGILWQWQRAREEAERARLNAYVADMNLAHQAYTEGNLGRAHELLRRHQASSARGWEWRYLSETCRGNEQSTIGSFSNGVSVVELSPDGSSLAVGTYDGTVQFWNPITQVKTGRVILEGRVRSMAFSPDSQFLAIGTLDNKVSVWDWRQITRRIEFACEQWSHGGALAFNPDGKSLVVAGRKGEIEVRGIPGFDVIGRLEGHTSGSRSLAFSRDGRYLASGGDEEKLRVWDVGTRKLLRTFLKPHAFAVNSVEFAPDGKSLASCGWDGDVKLWDVDTGQALAIFNGHASVVYRARFSPDGARLVTAGLDQTIRIWDIRSRRQIARLQGHEDEVNTLTFYADGSSLISGGKDGQVKTWEMKSEWPEFSFLALEPGIIGGDVAGDGTMVAVQYLRRVDVWNANSRQRLATFAHDYRSGSVVCAGNNGVMACISHNQNVLIFADGISNELKAIEVPANTASPAPKVTAMALSQNGKHVLIASTSGEARVLDWAVSRELFRWHMPTGECVVAVSPDGQLVARGGENGAVQIWRLADGVCMADFPAHQGTIGSVCFSPDGRHLASGGWDSWAKLWQVSNARLVGTFRGFRSGVFRVAFTPDGSRLATGTTAIKLWDLETHQEVLTLREHPAKVLMGFMNDGKTLVSASTDGIRFWRAPSLKSFEDVGTGLR